MIPIKLLMGGLKINVVFVIIKDIIALSKEKKRIMNEKSNW
jgi:hypothetical protein